MIKTRYLKRCMLISIILIYLPSEAWAQHALTSNEQWSNGYGGEFHRYLNSLYLSENDIKDLKTSLNPGSQTSNKWINHTDTDFFEEKEIKPEDIPQSHPHGLITGLKFSLGALTKFKMPTDKLCLSSVTGCSTDSSTNFGVGANFLLGYSLDSFIIYTEFGGETYLTDMKDQTGVEYSVLYTFNALAGIQIYPFRMLVPNAFLNSLFLEGEVGYGVMNVKIPTNAPEKTTLQEIGLPLILRAGLGFDIGDFDGLPLSLLGEASYYKFENEHNNILSFNLSLLAKIL